MSMAEQPMLAIEIYLESTHFYACAILLSRQRHHCSVSCNQYLEIVFQVIQGCARLGIWKRETQVGLSLEISVLTLIGSDSSYWDEKLSMKADGSNLSAEF